MVRRWLVDETSKHGGGTAVAGEPEASKKWLCEGIYNKVFSNSDTVSYSRKARAVVRQAHHK